ncbi:MAG: DUF5615 family PIN-like protein, partial [Thermoguttaceae bacterium]
MRINEFAFLADENLHPEVVSFLRSLPCDVLYARDGLIGSSDSVLMQLACKQQRVVITHDKDFGALAIVRRTYDRNYFPTP